MGRTQVYLNCSPITVLNYSIRKEGERIVDEMKFKVPPCQNISINDDVTVLQDIIPLCSLVAYWSHNENTFQEIPTTNQTIGASQAPRSSLHFEFNCNTNKFFCKV